MPVGRDAVTNDFCVASLTCIQASGDHSDIPQADLPLIKDHIQKQSFKVTSIFASFGSPQITFLLPSDADRYMALGTFAVPPKVSKHLAHVEPLKEIPLEHPFELVVSRMHN